MSRFNYQTQHLSGTQRHMADKYYNDIKKQQEKTEKEKIQDLGKESEHIEEKRKDMEPSKLFQLIKKFDTDNPGKKVMYDTKDIDYLEQKATLDYLVENQYINIISVSESLIEVELTEKGKSYKEINK